MRFEDLLHKFPTVRKAWRAGHSRQPKHDDVPFLKMCEDLNKCMAKLSVKTSSKLLHGAVRTYKEELAVLYNDAMELNHNLITRNKRTISDENKLSEPALASLSQQASSSESMCTPLPASTLYSSSTTKTGSTIPSTLPSLEENTSQPQSISSSVESTSQTESSSQPKSTTSQPKSIYLPKSTRSQSKSTSKQEFTTSEMETTPQPNELASQFTSTFQSESLSLPKSSYQPVLSPEQLAQSESSSDHEDYFPLPSDSPEHMRRSECSSDYEDVSPTYVKKQELLINQVRYRALSTITEEDISICQNIESSAFDTSPPMDISVPINEQSKRSTGHENSLSPQSIILTSSNIQNTQNRLASRKVLNSDAVVEISEHNSSKLQGTAILDVVSEELSQTEQGFEEAFIRTTEGSTENSDTNNERTALKRSIILQSSNISETKRLRKEKSKDEEAGTARMKDQAIQVCPLQLNLSESSRLVLNFGESSRGRNQNAQLSPMSNALESELPDPSSPGTRNVKDQHTQACSLHANSFDENLLFGSASLYGQHPCQCDKRVPCVIIYSSINIEE